MPRQLIHLTEPELAELLKRCAHALMNTCSAANVERPHFALLLFNDPGAAQYIANCEREDVIKSMRATADRLESRQTLERVEFPR